MNSKSVELATRKPSFPARSMVMCSIICSLALFSAWAVHAEMHKCRGADGKITYSDVLCDPSMSSVKTVSPSSTFAEKERLGSEQDRTPVEPKKR
jgi:hypothetical protein